MSYRSTYSLGFKNLDINSKKADDIFKKLYEISDIAFQAIDQREPVFWDLNDLQKDFGILSLIYNDIVFEISVVGEDSDDLWKIYFLNGKYQIAESEIVYKSFHTKKLNDVDINQEIVCEQCEYSIVSNHDIICKQNMSMLVTKCNRFKPRSKQNPFNQCKHCKYTLNEIHETMTFCRLHRNNVVKTSVTCDEFKQRLNQDNYIPRCKQCEHSAISEDNICSCNKALYMFSKSCDSFEEKYKVKCEDHTNKNQNCVGCPYRPTDSYNSDLPCEECTYYISEQFDWTSRCQECKHSYNRRCHPSNIFCKKDMNMFMKICDEFSSNPIQNTSGLKCEDCKYKLCSVKFCRLHRQYIKSSFIGCDKFTQKLNDFSCRIQCGTCKYCHYEGGSIEDCNDENLWVCKQHQRLVKQTKRIFTPKHSNGTDKIIYVYGYEYCKNITKDKKCPNFVNIFNII